MTIESTKNISPDNNIVMILYGRGGVGKTTFAATAPKPLIIDFENGTKYLGERGLNADVIRMAEWFTPDDKRQLKSLLPKYDTIILDPIGEAMEKLIASHGLDGRKFRAPDGGLTMAGWGEAKRQMKELVKWLRDAGKNVILIAHVAEGKDGEQTTYRIQIQTKLSDELPTMVDIISYMGIQKGKDGKNSVVLYTPAQGGVFDSKDRTGRVPEIVNVSESNGWSDFTSSFRPIVNPIQQTQNQQSSQQTQPQQTVQEPVPVVNMDEIRSAEITDTAIALEQILNDNKRYFKKDEFEKAQLYLQNGTTEQIEAIYKWACGCVEWAKNK